MSPRARDSATRDADAAHVDEIHAAVAERLTDESVRYTKTRRAVVDVLARAQQPLIVDEIRARTAAPLSSVYRTLAIFEAAGLVRRLTNDNSEYASFELAEYLLGHHHHLACATCGSMIDVALPSRLEADLDRALALLAKEQQFTLDGHRLDIIGTCGACTDPTAGADSATRC